MLIQCDSILLLRHHLKKEKTQKKIQIPAVIFRAIRFYLILSCEDQENGLSSEEAEVTFFVESRWCFLSIYFFSIEWQKEQKECYKSLPASKDRRVAGIRYKRCICSCGCGDHTHIHNHFRRPITLPKTTWLHWRQRTVQRCESVSQPELNLRILKSPLIPEANSLKFDQQQTCNTGSSQ